MNKILQKYDTPHETFPFGEVSLGDYEEAIMQGMTDEDKEIEAIVNNPDEPDFRNTIVALECAGDLLGKATEVFFNLLSCSTTDEMDELSEKLSPILSDHATRICFNKRLFERVRYVYEHADRSSLTPEDLMLLDDTYKGFTRSGVNLPEDRQERLREISNEMSLLDLKFSQNKLKETNDFILHITDEEDLAGLPESAVDAARTEARKRKKEGWVFTLHSPSLSPFMTYSSRRELRRQMYMASNTICFHDNKRNNTTIVKRIVDLCREEAQILGYDNYADFVLEERMAGNKENVYRLFSQLITAYKPTALKEQEALKAMARELEGEDFELKPWDKGYYSNKLKERLYDINSEMLRPYLELSKVKQGIFGLATRLYGISFVKRDDIPVYNEEVDTYEVFDEDGRYLAVLYCDFHPREDKKSGAWMTTFKGQWKEEDGTDSRPHVSLVMNLTRPTEDKPSLLTLGEVETFLHEFGHALHEIFADGTYGELSGSNVDWDFVELPSQLMENFSVEKDFLSTFARHYKTDEPLPDALIDRVVASKNFNIATDCLSQVRYGLLDMAFYTLEHEFEGDIEAFEQEAWKDAQITETTSGTCMSVQFSHIMAGGYAAGYYSYKWAEVLDADAFSVFRHNGIFDRATAQRFRDCILSKGGTEKPMTLYKRFRGCEPTIDALLERNGIHNHKS
ncbi:MAG: M3 family metallopeptidase [Bacteroidaceae bacterium]|nr:M3 family metallopeptidase [Bacteroidaceae bacterium]